MNLRNIFFLLIILIFIFLSNIFIQTVFGKKIINKIDNILVQNLKDKSLGDFTKEKYQTIINGNNTFFIRHAPKPLILSSGLQRLSLIKKYQNRTIIKKSSCLSEIGREEAYMIGKIFEDNNIQIDKVYSSPLCRASETALIAFNKIDEIHSFLLYDGIISKKNRKINLSEFRDFFFNYKKNTNRVIVSHGHKLKNIGLNYGTEQSGIIIYNHESEKIVHVFNNLDELAKIYYLN